MSGEDEEDEEDEDVVVVVVVVVTSFPRESCNKEIPSSSVKSRCGLLARMSRDTLLLEPFPAHSLSKSETRSFKHQS